MNYPDRPIVLSLEQALSMPYGTLRFIHLGWRVIRVEATPIDGQATPGDPNRYIGRPAAGHDRHSYYVAPNAGKEAIAINLKSAEGRELLHRLVTELPVDVFCTNTMPSRHEALGVDAETLRGLREELIWCGISAMGLKHPDVPGYDPAIQALCGLMDLTGERDRPPMQCGPPVTDLKAGDEVFAQVLLAMWERERNGVGKVIDVSLAHGAVSWLHTFLPMLDMGSPPDELRRNGNKHRQFIPVNAYPTNDGFIYVALGSDVQWGRLVAHEWFAELDEAAYRTNEGRRAGQAELHAKLAEITAERTTDEVAEALRSCGVPHSPITPIEEVPDLPFVEETTLFTTTPDGKVVRLPPPAVPIAHLDEIGRELPFPPEYGEDTDRILAEVGCDEAEIAAWREAGVVA